MLLNAYFYSMGLKWGLRISISTNFPGVAVAVCFPKMTTAIYPAPHALPITGEVHFPLT